MHMENYQKTGDKCGEATMKLALANVYLEANRLQDALRWAMEAQEEFKASQLEEKEVSAYLTMAKALLAKCDAAEALQTSQRALAIAEEVGDMRGEALSLQCLAKALCQSQEIKEAIDAARKSLTIFRQSSDYKQQAASLLAVASIHLARERPQDALRSAKDAQHLSKRIGDSRGVAHALVVVAEAQVENDEQREAMVLLKEAQDRYQALKDVRGEVEALRVRAKAESSMCKRNEALSSLQEGVELARRIDDKVAEATLLRQTARVKMNLLRLEECEQHLNEAQGLFRDAQHWRGEADVLELLLRQQIQVTSRDAVGTADEWRALFYDAGDRKGEANCLREAARMFFTAGYEQDAESRAQEALAIFQELEDQTGEARTQLLLAEVHSGFGDVRRGVQTAEESLELFKRIEDPKGQSDAYAVLARVQMLEDGGDAEEAASAAEKSYQLVKRARKGWATRRIEVISLQLLAEAGVAKLVKLAGDEDVQDKSQEEQDMLQGIFDKAHRAAEMAVDRAGSMDDRRMEASAMRTLANVCLVCSDTETAAEAAREALKIAQEVGDKKLEGTMLCINAEVNVVENYMGKANEQAKQALGIFRELRDAEGEEYAKSILDQMYGTSRGGVAAGPGAGVPAYETGMPTAAAAASSVAMAVSEGPTREYIMEGLRQLSKNVVGDDIDMDSPLMEAGMDSLSSVEFRNQVRNLVPGINLPASMVFDYPLDAEMKGFVDGCMAKLGAAMDQVVGATAVDLDSRFASIRTKETNIGNFVTDVMRHALKADVAMLNSGTLRADAVIEQGEIKVRDLVNLLPMLDELCLLQLSGAQVLEALENSVSQYPRLEGRFAQVSGVSFQFDAAKPPNHRIVDGSVRIGTDLLDLEKNYKLCTKDYLRQGKDGYDVFREGICLADGETAGILPSLVRDCFANLDMLNGESDVAKRSSTFNAVRMLETFSPSKVGDGPEMLKRYAIDPVVEVVSSLFLKLAEDKVLLKGTGFVAWRFTLRDLWLQRLQLHKRKRKHMLLGRAQQLPTVKSFVKGLLAHLLIVPPWVIPPGLLLGSLLTAGAPFGAKGLVATMGVGTGLMAGPKALRPALCALVLLLAAKAKKGTAMAGAIFASFLTWLVTRSGTISPKPEFFRFVSTWAKDFYTETALRGALSDIRPTKSFFGFHPHGCLCAGFTINGAYNPDFIRAATRVAWLCDNNLRHKNPGFQLMSEAYQAEDRAIEACDPEGFKLQMSKGVNVAFIPGGFLDAVAFEFGKDVCVLRKKKGFIKYCLQCLGRKAPRLSNHIQSTARARYGYRAHPVYTFGECET
ncbi:mggB [Symbiodinium pilosum]|uniref:MggB protein n=1 Tax=Symbiodinium pilosum TaxID=2952 RepID=A0A812TIA3_SYMPI|nr:mggB [Symbiodinium pilosum]